MNNPRAWRLGVDWENNLMMTPPLVLLIEDEPLIRIDVESALAEARFEVITAGNATSAMAAFDERMAEISAVVTDIRLGKGASGWDVGKHVREGVASMPVIYMSGDSSAEWASHGVPNSIMVPKPFVFAQLVTAISTLLNKAE